MARLLTALPVALMTATLAAQELPALPTPQESMAKWPWAISLQAAPFVRQSVEFTLAPLEGMEYKYRLGLREAVLYSWTSTGDVHSELHSHPDNPAQGGYADFFSTIDGNASHGAFSAPYVGIHGWRWENLSDVEVTITLTTAGFYTESHEFRRGDPVKITPIE